MIEIVDSFEANSTSDVKSIAEKLGVVFPPDFADFLLLHNGGTFFHTAIFLENEWWKVGVLDPLQRSGPGFYDCRPQVFQWLLSNGVNTSIKTNGLGDVRSILSRKKDKGHSPIGWKDQLRALDAAAS